MATIELKYVHGEEMYACSECGEEIYPEFVEDFLHERAKRCPDCGALIEDIDF